MADDAEWLKLPPDEKCVHKNWKARVAGYEEAVKLFNGLDEKSPEFNKFLGVLKKICVDTNAIAQEKALDAVLAFVENAHVAGRTCGEVMTALVTKCLNASRAKTKEKALEIILMYIEIDKHETVQEELMKGLENKQPKVVYACVQALRSSLESFGPKVVTLKPVVKILPKLLEDRDKTVREETKMLVVEVYRWIGAALKPQLANLKPVQITELESEFEKLPPGKPVQTRFMRSQQDLKAKAEAAAAAADAGEDDGVEEDGPAVEMDPMDLVDPVDILVKLPKNFYEQIEAKKWQERKEMLEEVEKLVTDNPKLLPGEYADLVRALKKVLSKDTNVMLVALAGKCLCGLAKGLRKKFSPYAVQCTEAILVKFKEKKPMVVTALRDAIDAIFVATTLEAITEDLLTALNDKNPNVKAESAAFLARCFTKATTTTLTKKNLKPFIEPLSKTINDTSPEVREASFEALGTAMKVISEKVLTALMGDVDSLKMAKIKECCDKAVLVNMKGKAASKPPAAAPAKAAPAKSAPPQKKQPPKTGKPPAVAASAKAGAAAKKKPAGSGGGKGKGKGAAESKPVEALLSDEAVDEKANALLGEENVSLLANSNWKQRLAAMENIEQEIKRTPKEDMPTQAIVRVLGSKKPGLKDNNFQVLKLRLSSLLYLAENFNFSWTSAECLLADLVDKIGDAKNGQGCKDVLTAVSEATEFPQVAGEVVRIAFAGKNPKNQAESLNWLAQAIYDFGFKVNIKPLVSSLKVALAATNPTVRQSAVTLLGVCYIYMGTPLRTLFEDEKPALLSLIDAEFDKVKGQKPPAPVRGLKGLGDTGETAEDEEAEDDGPSEDLIPRNDISDQINDAMLEKLSDKNWKVRKEGLDEVTTILNEAKFITANLGGLPEALKHRLSDSNKILVTTTLGILKTIGNSSGVHCKRHVPVLAGALISTLGDSKPMVRQAACATLDVWVEQTTIKPFIEDGVFAESLKIENPNLRSTLLGWLAPKLKDYQKKMPVEIKECCYPLLTCLGDRNPDVRKAAQEAILPFMLHTGFDSMLKAASKVDKSSKDAVVALLEKAKADLPAKPKKVLSTPVVQSHISTQAIDDILNDQDDDANTPPSAATSSKKPAKSAPAGKSKRLSVARGKSAPATSRKKEVEVDTSPIITITNTKAQRMKDEKNLKVLKWNFTAPRPEFFDQLRDQMEKNFSATIMEYLMHKDFQKHIIAIQMLSKALDEYKAETMANVDLILKWFTLRFFETNPSMLNKALEYLLSLFNTMAEEEVKLTQLEAESFIPYLILKVGESKENVRKEVRKIFYAICLVYPVSKMFMFVMGGLASKNAKQRAECLEELGCMMEKNGLEICQPSPKEALKEIAKQIGDRDNSVRNAALNTVVVAHQIVGDQVYKYVGKLNDKDLGMLEERIKRASRSKPVKLEPPKTAKVEPSTPAGSSKRSRPSTAPLQAPTTNGHLPDSSHQARPSTADPKFRKELPPEFTITTNWNPDLSTAAAILAKEPIDVSELIKPFPIPQLKTRTLKVGSSPAPRSNTLLDQSPDAKSAIDMTVTNIASSDLQTAASALAQMAVSMSESGHHNLIRRHVDQMIIMTTLQLKQLQTRHLEDSTIPQQLFTGVYTKCVALLTELSDNNMMTKTSITAEVIKDLFNQAISTVVDPRVSRHPDGPMIIQQLNVLIAKVITTANLTTTLCAGLKLLHDSVGPVHHCSEPFIELVQKCLWKMTRALPERIASIEMNPVLELCNNFLNTYPRSYWANQPSDKPLKTVKTILTVLIQNASERVMSAVTLATYSPKADLETIIRKTLSRMAKTSTSVSMANTMNVTEQGDVSMLTSQSDRMGKYIHDSVATIFKKIGSRENSKEGLMELYNFRERYPDADLEPFLKKSSAFFQMYIQRGLQSIEEEKKKSQTQAATNSVKLKPSTGPNRVLPVLEPRVYYKPLPNTPILNPIPSPTLPKLEWRRISALFSTTHKLNLSSGSAPASEVDWDERLRKHRERMQKLGIGASTSTGSIPQSISKPPDVVLSTRTSNVMDDATRPIESRYSSSSQGQSSTTSSANTNSAELLDLKARLERIKKSSQN